MSNLSEAYIFAKDFNEKHEIEMDNIQLARFVDELVKFREAAQQGVQSDGVVRCQVAGCMKDGVYCLCGEHANSPRR